MAEKKKLRNIHGKRTPTSSGSQFVEMSIKMPTTLSGGELDRLVGRSVDDIKPNYAGRYLSVMAMAAARPLKLLRLCSSSF
jgi:hypothetical protein